MLQQLKQNTGKLSIAALAALLPSVHLMAQSSAPSSAGSSASVSPLWWLIILVMIVLLIAVLILSNVLLNIARLVVEKAKAGKTGTAALLLLLITLSVTAQGAADPSATTVNAKPLVDANLVLAFLIIIIELLAVVILTIRIQKMLKELAGPKTVAEPEVAHSAEHVAYGKVAPRWRYALYACIVIACAYLASYQSSVSFYNSDAYQEESKVANSATTTEPAKPAEPTIDENNVPLADAAGIAEGHKLFSSHCTPCHGADGGSTPNGVGPNLTDDYWLHGGSLSDIFKTITNGVPDKGMQSWKSTFSPVQIQDLASFVKSIHGTKVATPKEPQGVLYKETPTTAKITAATDKAKSTASK